jgi:glyoxylate reductase
VAVLRRIPDSALEMLREHADVWVSEHDRPLTREELVAAIVGTDCVVSMLHDRIDAELLDAAGEQLRCVANVAVGYDNIDVAAASQRGVLVTNTPGVLTDATADLAMGLILAVTRRFGEGERLVRSLEWWSWHMFFMLGTSIQGKTLGIVGLGQIGQATARRARAFGMEIVYSQRRQADPAVEEELGGARHVELEELLETADVVSLHVPLTPDTRHLIDADGLRRMRNSAYLVNTARGAVVDEAALAAALRDGEIAGAGLDVYENEPEVHPDLLGLENVVLLPHLGSATIETRTAMAELAASNVVAVLTGKTPPTPVNPEVSGVSSGESEREEVR